jgi:hypothetical protein
MSTMTYLTDCAGGDAGAHGGSTVVWPRSARRYEWLVQGSIVLQLCTTVHPLHAGFMERLGASVSATTMRPNPSLAATDPARFRLMWDLGAARAEAGVGEPGAEAPLELRRAAGHRRRGHFCTALYIL